MTTPYTDPAMERLARYLMDWLNTEFARAYPAQNQIVVKSYRSFDDFGAPYSDYPLLKCYRMFEDCSLEDEKDNVTAIISYGLVYPDLLALQPLVVWVRKEIGNALKAWRITHRACVPVLTQPRYRAEYRTMLNERTQKVHNFMRITINFTDYDP